VGSASLSVRLAPRQEPLHDDRGGLLPAGGPGRGSLPGSGAARGRARRGHRKGPERSTIGREYSVESLWMSVDTAEDVLTISQVGQVGGSAVGPVLAVVGVVRHREGATSESTRAVAVIGLANHAATTTAAAL